MEDLLSIRIGIEGGLLPDTFKCASCAKEGRLPPKWYVVEMATNQARIENLSVSYPRGRLYDESRRTCALYY